MSLSDWFTRELYEPWRAGIASVFIVHGDVNCLVRNPDAEDEPDTPFIPIRRFWEKCFENRELVVYYNIASGAWTMKPEMMKAFMKAAGVDAPAAGADADPVAAAKAGLAAKRGLPKEPEACLPLIAKALFGMEDVAVIIESAHTIAPATNVGGALPANERATIERLRIWGRSSQVRKRKNLVLLLTDQAAKLSQELRLSDTQIRTVFIPKPGKDERREFIASRLKEAGKEIKVEAGLRKGKGMDVDVMAHATQGMSLMQIGEIFLQARSDGRPVGLSFVKDTKRRLLNNEYGDVMEVLEPERGLEDIGGHEHIKRYFRGVLDAIRAGESRLVPMGVTLMGPPGTGKTAIVEALAKEAGFNFVKTKNIRSMWLGESESRMEKLVAGLRSLAPVVVMNDEADLAEAQRDSPKGDSGVSERLMKAWMELLSDPRIRGQIIVISCTNRPDRMDAALKRSGRSDERILMPMPSAEEREAIFKVMFKRHGIPAAIDDFSGIASAENISGADIEKIVLGSYQFACEQGKKKVDPDALRAAVGDFIPSASMADIDGMTVAGLLECSSRRLLPPHVKEILTGIAERGLVPDLDEVFAQLKARNILPEGLEPKAVAVLPPNNENN